MIVFTPHIHFNCRQTCLPVGREKLEIVSGAAHFDFAQYKPPPFRIFAGGFLAAAGGEVRSNYFKNGAQRYTLHF